MPKLTIATAKKICKELNVDFADYEDLYDVFTDEELYPTVKDQEIRLRDIIETDCG